MLEISVKKSKNIGVLELSGSIDIDSSNFIEKVGWCLENGYKDILCNFENVNFVDYAGLSVIAIAFKNVLNHKGRMKLLKVPLHVKKIFSLMCLDRVVEIYDSTEAALKSFEEDKIIADIQKKKLRRRFKRLPLDIGIEFRSEARKDEYESGKVLNISAVGLLIFCEKTYPLSDILDIKLSLKPHPGTLEVKAKVVWLVSKEIQPQIYPGMGLEFHELDNDTQEKIAEFVERNLPMGNCLD